jgi:hypothetical protein
MSLAVIPSGVGTVVIAPVPVFEQSFHELITKAFITVVVILASVREFPLVVSDATNVPFIGVVASTPR